MYIILSLGVGRVFCFRWVRVRAPSFLGARAMCPRINPVWYVGKETTNVLAGVGGRRAQGVSRGGHAGTRAASRWDMRVERSEVRERRGIVRVRDVQRGAEGTRAGAQVGEGRRLGLCYCIVAVWRYGTRAAPRFLSRSVLLKSRVGMSG